MPIRPPWWSLLLLLLVAACSSNNAELPRAATFTPGQGDKALVVVGVAALRYDTIFGMTARGTVADIGMQWTRLQNGVAPERERERETVRLQRRSCFDSGILSANDQYGQPCDMRDMSRLVMLVDPGDYQLSEITRTTSNGGGTLTRMTDNAGLVTRVGAGEVVYLGDFTMDLIGGPARVVRYGRNDEAARRALAAYPGVAPGLLTYRVPVPRSQLFPVGGARKDSPLMAGAIIPKALPDGGSSEAGAAPAPSAAQP